MNELKDSRMFFAGVALVLAGVVLIALGREDTGSIVLMAGIGAAGLRAIVANEVNNGATKK